MCGCSRMRSSGKVRLLVLALTTVALATAGCGSALKAKTANDLKVLGIAYHNYINNNNKPPDRLEDLQAVMAGDPQVYQALADGKYVFIYGVAFKDMPGGSSNTVMGYEKDAPTKGGYVLFGDGAVRSMSAKEFQAAPKAQAPTKASGESK